MKYLEPVHPPRSLPRSTNEEVDPSDRSRSRRLESDAKPGEVKIIRRT